MSPGPLPLSMIAAVARNGVIGAGGRMPWRLPGDLAHFRAATMGKPLIVGRRTYESIGGPLPGRTLVVVSRRGGVPRRNDIVGVDDIGEAVRCARELAAASGASEVIVAGGGAIYAELLEQAAILLLTEVDASPNGDTFFPAIDRSDWREAMRGAPVKGPADAFSYSFVRYDRHGARFD